MIDAKGLLGALVRDVLGGEQGRTRPRRPERGIGRSATGARGMGALGVAMAAFEHFAQNRGAPTAASGSVQTLPDGASTPPLPSGEDGAQVLPPLPVAPEAQPSASETAGEAALMIHAMVAAANADHRLDADERGRIERALVKADLSEETRLFLRRQLEHPWSLAQLVESANTPELARDVYLASLMAIDIDQDAERNYLAPLGERLGLAADTVVELQSLLHADQDSALRE